MTSHHPVVYPRCDTSQHPFHCWSCSQTPPLPVSLLVLLSGTLLPPVSLLVLRSGPSLPPVSLLGMIPGLPPYHPFHCWAGLSGWFIPVLPKDGGLSGVISPCFRPERRPLGWVLDLFYTQKVPLGVGFRPVSCSKGASLRGLFPVLCPKGASLGRWEAVHPGIYALPVHPSRCTPPVHPPRTCHAHDLPAVYRHGLVCGKCTSGRVPSGGWDGPQECLRRCFSACFSQERED